MAISKLKPLEQHIFEIKSRGLARIILKEKTIAIPRGAYTIITEVPMEGLIIYAFFSRENNLLNSDTVIGTKQDYNSLIHQCKRYFLLKEEFQQDI